MSCIRSVAVIVILITTTRSLIYVSLHSPSIQFEAIKQPHIPLRGKVKIRVYTKYKISVIAFDTILRTAGKLTQTNSNNRRVKAKSSPRIFTPDSHSPSRKNCALTSAKIPGDFKIQEFRWYKTKMNEQTKSTRYKLQHDVSEASVQIKR